MARGYNPAQQQQNTYMAQSYTPPEQPKYTQEQIKVRSKIIIIIIAAVFLLPLIGGVGMFIISAAASSSSSEVEMPTKSYAGADEATKAILDKLAVVYSSIQKPTNAGLADSMGIEYNKGDKDNSAAALEIYEAFGSPESLTEFEYFYDFGLGNATIDGYEYEYANGSWQ